MVRPEVRRQSLSTKDGDASEEEARLLGLAVVAQLRQGRRAAHQQQQGDPANPVQQPLLVDKTECRLRCLLFKVDLDRIWN